MSESSFTLEKTGNTIEVFTFEWSMSPASLSLSLSSIPSTTRLTTPASPSHSTSVSVPDLWVWDCLAAALDCKTSPTSGSPTTSLATLQQWRLIRKYIKIALFYDSKYTIMKMSNSSTQIISITFVKKNSTLNTLPYVIYINITQCPSGFPPKTGFAQCCTDSSTSSRPGRTAFSVS